MLVNPYRPKRISAVIFRPLSQVENLFVVERLFFFESGGRMRVGSDRVSMGSVPAWQLLPQGCTRLFGRREQTRSGTWQHLGSGGPNGETRREGVFVFATKMFGTFVFQQMFFAWFSFCLHFFFRQLVFAIICLCMCFCFCEVFCFVLCVCMFVFHLGREEGEHYFKAFCFFVFFLHFVFALFGFLHVFSFFFFCFFLL